MFGVTCDDSGPSKRPKYSETMRSERIASIQEKLTTLNKHIKKNKKRLQQKIDEKKFDMCDMNVSETKELESERLQLEAELRVFQTKDKKAEWYLKKKQTPLPSSDSEHDGVRSDGSGVSIVSGMSSASSNLSIESSSTLVSSRDEYVCLSLMLRHIAAV